MDLIPGLGRSPGGGNGNPLQYFCLGYFMDRGACRATWNLKELDMTEHTRTYTHTHTDVYILISRTLEYIIFLIKGMLQDLEKIILHCLVRTNAITKILKRERQEIRV